MAQSGVADNIFSPADQVSNIVSSKESYVGLKRGGKTIYMKDKHAFVRPRHPKRLEFAPTTLTSIPLGGSEVQHEHRIYEQNDFETADWITLRGVINKSHVGGVVTTAGSYLVEPSPLWITRIELLANGSTTPLHTIYGDQIWVALQCLPAEKLAMFMGANLMYMGTDFKVNNSIQGNETWAHCNTGGVSPVATLGASYSRPFIIPILASLLGNMRLRALSGDTIWRVYWNPSIFREPANIFVDAINSPNFQEGVLPARLGTPGPIAGSAQSVWTLTNLELVLESEEVLESDKLSAQRLFDNSILLVKYLEPVVQTFTVTMSPGVETALQLTAFTGDFAFMQIYVRDPNRALCSLKALTPEFNSLMYSGTGLNPGLPSSANRALSEYTDAHPTGRITITDASVRPLFSPNGFKPWDVRYAHHAKHHVNLFNMRHPMYSIYFCENPIKAILDGEVDGYASFCAQEYVRITPSDFFTMTDNAASGSRAGTARVTIVGWRIKHVEIMRRMARPI